MVFWSQGPSKSDIVLVGDGEGSEGVHLWGALDVGGLVDRDGGRSRSFPAAASISSRVPRWAAAEESSKRAYPWPPHGP